MKTRTHNKTEEEVLRQHTRRKMTIIITACTLLIVAGIVAVVLLVGRGRATVKGTLEQYYQTMYTDNGKGFDDMAECFAPDLSTDWYNNMTVFGMNFSALSSWRMESLEQVGGNVSCKVKITEQESGSATSLATTRQTYANAQALCDVIFQLNISGDTGSMVTHGVTEMVKINGKWYFVSTSIPMTVESRKGSSQEWYEQYGDEGLGN